MEKIERGESMIVISDTTPLISLMKIGQLRLVNQLFGEIQIPDAVYTELVSNPNFSEEEQEIKSSLFIKRVSVKDSKSVELLRKVTGLDAGESEAIILSDESKADLLLMDEIKGRNVAKQMGLQVMGTVGMLLAAYDEKLLYAKEIEECIKSLRSSGRHISDRLFEQLIKRIHINEIN